jgi:hypothetical protein
MVCLLHRLADRRQGKQQNVVGRVGVAAPVALTELGVQLPPLCVTVRRKSPGCWTAAQFTGAMYEMPPPEQVPFVDDDTVIVAEHVAPETLPQLQAVHARVSSTPP